MSNPNQEFLALLLDTLHDELMAAKFSCDMMKCSAAAMMGQAPLLFKANSSMEMNAAESAQMDDEDAAAGGGECSMIKTADGAGSVTSAAAAAPGATLATSEDDRTSARESESASPKSFDSHSSIGKGKSKP